MRSAASCCGGCGKVQRLAESQPADDEDDGVLLLEGSALRLQAHIRWLEACEERWTGRTR
jgi:hypothetical protein